MYIFKSAKDKIIYLAALLEGEGCFVMSRNSPRIHYNSTDEDVVKNVAEMFHVPYRLMGGKTRIRHKEDWKPCYNVTINGQKAIELMMSILPLMGKRRQDKIMEVITRWKTIPFRTQITFDMAQKIRKDFNGSYQNLAGVYGVDYTVIWNIVNNKSHLKIGRLCR